MSILPAPALIGAPEKFADWNPDQAEALLTAIDSPKRFVGLVLPTGSGKTLIGPMLRYLTGKRVAILTSTKALQDQIQRDGFSELMVAMGQSAYECLAVRPGGELAGSVESPTTCDKGPCRAKVRCSLKDLGCLYYDTLRKAKTAPLVVTNYAYWMTQYRYGQGLGNFDILVLDEAHAAPDELAGLLNTELRFSDIKNALNTTPPPHPKPDTPMPEQMAGWKQWARIHAGRLERQLNRTGNEEEDSAGVSGTPVISPRDIGRHIRLTHLLRVLQMIGAMDPDMWLVHNEIDRAVFDPVWVAGYAESTLFKGVPKVVLMSATFRPKTADLLGLDRADMEFYEARSGFDKARRPVYVMPSAPRVDHRMDDLGFNKWMGLINNILDSRTDRKGIIHTISYKRRNEIVRLSRHRDRMLSHDRENTRQVIEEFKRAPAGTILVSPSVTTGYDFPFTECEFQIVCKVPFPDSRDPVLKARTEEDRDYGAYMAMQELVQAIGRGMRASTDSCESFIVDAHAVWFLSKYRDLAPKWFHEAIKKIDLLPAPLPKLEDR